jgi:hypothetical protein
MHIVKGVDRFQVAASLRVLGQGQRIDSVSALKGILCEGEVYLVLGTAGATGMEWVAYVLDYLPSQFMRQVIAAVDGAPRLWDWRRHPEVEKVAESIERLGPRLRVDLRDRAREAFELDSH